MIAFISSRDRTAGRLRSQKNLDLLTEYWYKCGRPKDILFPSSWTGGYLDIASVNQFFKKSAKLAGITRRVSSHACRHSFASHLFHCGIEQQEDFALFS